MENGEKNINIACSANAPIYQRVKYASLIFEQYGDFLRTIIFFNIKNISEVDDIMQDFFISLVEHPIREDIEDIKSYLYRAIINDIIDAKRRTKSFKEHVFKYADFTNNASQQQIQHEEIILENEEIKKVLKIIKNYLPAHEAQALLNYYISDYDIKTAAERMKLNIRTFSRYVSTGIKKFRSFLELSDNNSL